jgi:hypothetical protein
MKKLKQQFLEVSDALALGNPAIIEKDYWVVALLGDLEALSFDTRRVGHWLRHNPYPATPLQFRA